MTMPKYEYKSVPIRTVAEIKKAESLQARGWRLMQYGSAGDTALFERVVYA
jgi:hypothetical protein